MPLPFLFTSNQGYPMTISDMASAFQFNDTAGANSTVHYDGPKQNTNAYSSLSDGEDPNACYNPKSYLIET